MCQLTPKDPDEHVRIAFDYTMLLSAGETITSASVVSSLQSGRDPSPGSLVSGAADIVDGNTVVQMIVGGTEGATYLLKCKAQTSSGQQLVVASTLPVHTWCD